MPSIDILVNALFKWKKKTFIDVIKKGWTRSEDRQGNADHVVGVTGVRDQEFMEKSELREKKPGCRDDNCIWKSFGNNLK